MTRSNKLQSYIYPLCKEGEVIATESKHFPPTNFCSSKLVHYLLLLQFLTDFSHVARPSSPADDCRGLVPRTQQATHATRAPNLLRSHLIKRAGELTAGSGSQVGRVSVVATATHCVFLFPGRTGCTESQLRGQLVQTAGAVFSFKQPRHLNYRALALRPCLNSPCVPKQMANTRE